MKIIERAAKAGISSDSSTTQSQNLEVCLEEYLCLLCDNSFFLASEDEVICPHCSSKAEVNLLEEVEDGYAYKIERLTA